MSGCAPAAGAGAGSKAGAELASARVAGAASGASSRTTRAAVLGQGGEQRLLGEQDRGARVVEHQLLALARIGGVERHVGATGLQDREQGDDQVDRPLGADRHPLLGSDPQLAEVAGEDGGASASSA